MCKPQITFSLLLVLMYSHVNAQALYEESSFSNGLHFQYSEALKMGGGAASFDYDNDGDDDLYIVGGQNPDGLFENDGNGYFSDISLTTNISSLTENAISTSVVTGDIDNDGIREIFIGTIGDPGTSFESLRSNILLKYNTQTHEYEDITEESSLNDISFCMGAHFFDSNLDGYLDLYLINYVAVPKLIQEGSDVVGFDHECFDNKLYINNGDGSFEDKTDYYGLNGASCSLAATASDLDWDGDSDLIVANDFGKWLQPNQLFQNQGGENPYTDISAEANIDKQMYAMGIAVGDYDEDLDLDFYVTNIGENAFFVNDGNMQFHNKAELLDIDNTLTSDGLFTTGWGAIFEDFNNDSFLDLFVSNGYVYSAVDIDDTKQNDELFLGSEVHEFTKVTPECGIDFKGTSRGALTGDWNRDGRLDIITITNESILTTDTNSINYYTNISEDQHNWVGFILEGNVSNKDAFGSKIILHAEGRTLLRELRGGDSHASQNSSTLHFGLADIQQIDSIVIYWPSGLLETRDDIEINTYQKIHEGMSTGIVPSGNYIEEVTLYPNPANKYINIKHESNNNAPTELKIIDSFGRLLLSKQIEKYPIRIETSEFSSGLYKLIILSESKGQISKKFLIIKP